jgi:hypothetical protein
MKKILSKLKPKPIKNKKMKKIIFVIAFVFVCFWVKAQDNVTVSDSVKYTYCEIVGTAKFLSTKVNIQIDFGQEVKFGQDKRYKDPATGKPYVFNSMIDALNFMGKDGWQFVQAYVVTESNSGSVYHYLLKKETNKLNQP